MSSHQFFGLEEDVEVDHNDELTNNPDGIEFEISDFIAGSVLGIVEIVSPPLRKGKNDQKKRTKNNWNAEKDNFLRTRKKDDDLSLLGRLK